MKKFCKYRYIFKYYNTTTMSTKLQQREDIVAMFMNAVDKVSPMKLITSAISKNAELCCLNICGKEFVFNPNRISLIGFGKASGEMAAAARTVLGNDLHQAILSVPHGTTASNSCATLVDDPKFRIYEGAKNNLPDENSMHAANEILKVVRKLEKDDLLLVLISGGGSALLPAPIAPVTLEEKQLVTKMLASAGATIQELNAIRTQLSEVKGGKLAKSAQPAEVVALILSDVIGDSLSVIASGPTFLSDDALSSSDILQILSKYNLEDKLPSSVRDILIKLPEKVSTDFENTLSFRIDNFLIGNNTIALNSAEKYAQALGYSTLILSSTVEGEASNLGQLYARLGQFLETSLQNGDYNIETYAELRTAIKNHGVKTDTFDQIPQMLKENNKLAIISGGETTVRVRGNGLGGRNQETVLAFILEMKKLKALPNNCRMTFLSAGTDGQDGPTSATGAIAYQGQLDEMPKDENLDFYLHNNDSHTFFKKFTPDDLIITGATGTNVMDIHILLLGFNL